MKTPLRKYTKWLAELKIEIQQSRLQTALKVNADMLILNWYISKQIIQKIDTEGWGTKVIDQLSTDLQKEFSDMQGLSVRSLKYMQKFAATYPNLLIVQQPVAQLQKASSEVIAKQSLVQFSNRVFILHNQVLVNIPWGHHVTLMDKIKNEEERLWYINKTVENNWSRTVLQYQIETDLYLRQHKTKKTSNFHLTLPKPQADLANQILKDPYVFRFLQLGESVSESQLEQELIKHIQEFILELGAGFSFVGRQVKFKTGKKEHFIDLLFYHLFLRCFIVIELKMEEFELAHTGQMNGYLNIVNKQLRHRHDNPSIGIILCGAKDSVEVDFALANINHPIGVSEYSFRKSLPEKFKNKLPSAKQLQNEVNKFLKKINVVNDKRVKRKI